MWLELRKKWQGALLALAAAFLLVQGLRSETRPMAYGGMTDPSPRVLVVAPRAFAASESLSPPSVPQPSAASIEIVPQARAAQATNATSVTVQPPQPTAAPANSNRVSAQAAPPAPTPLANAITPSTPIEATDLSGADRITIRFQGQTELSGDYRVADDQTISIPVVGRIAIGRLDAAGLEQVLAERVARLTGREAYVTVEIAEYRPVFVSGYVSRPGTAPWKPGLTVLQAITIAGGDYRSGSGGSDNVGLRGQRAIDDQKRYLAQIARLEAERAGAASITIPQRLIDRVGAKQARELIDAQNTVFQSRRSAAEAQVAGLQRAISLTKAEFDGMTAQKKRLSEQIDIRRGQYAKLKEVYDKGLLRNDRLVDEQIKLADLEEKIASVGVSAARASSTLAGLERELSNIRQDRNAAIDAELLKLERDVAQLEIELQGIGMASIRPSSAAGTQDDKNSVVYEIVRQERAGPRTLPADRYTVLRPGDLVVVSLKQ